MRDRREEILDRLTAIAQSLFAQNAVFRNRDEVPEDPRPAILINDGDESSPDPDPAMRSLSGTLAVMTPIITVFADPVNKEAAKIVAAKRAALLAAIMQDSTLLSITGPNGFIRYVGFSTTDELGRRRAASGAMAFSFRYPLLASELTA